MLNHSRLFKSFK